MASLIFSRFLLNDRNKKFQKFDEQFLIIRVCKLLLLCQRVRRDVLKVFNPGFDDGCGSIDHKEPISRGNHQRHGNDGKNGGRKGVENGGSHAPEKQIQSQSGSTFLSVRTRGTCVSNRGNLR